MARGPADTDQVDMGEVDAGRQRLEQNTSKLQKALEHWQTWQSEYEDLKEEIRALPPHSSRDDIVQLCSELKCSLITKNDVKGLFSSDTSIERTNEQVSNILSRRIEYVHQNVKNIEQQLKSEQRAHGCDRLHTNEEPRAEARLSVTEIFEELDDDGNVVSGRTTRPDESTGHVLRLLEDAGIDNTAAVSEEGLETIDADRGDNSDTTSNRSISGQISLSSRPSDRTKEKSHTQSAEGKHAGSMSRKKSVAFAEGTKPEAQTPISQLEHENRVRHEQPDEPKKVMQMSKGSFPDSHRVIELDEHDRPVAVKNAAVPANESPESAETRLQMLRYSMEEVSGVVAQLEVEERESDGSLSDEVDDTDEYLSDNSADYEDKRGLSRRHRIDDGYMQKMLELEKKLIAQTFQNIEPQENSDASAQPSDAKFEGQPNPQKHNLDFKMKNGNQSFVKSVRFADEVDGRSTSSVNHDVSTESEAFFEPAVKDVIVERKIPERIVDSGEQKKQRVSRFKAARS